MIQHSVAVITGASSGIGEATARLLAIEGVSVVLAARRKDRLDAITGEIIRGGGDALAHPCDVTKREEAEGHGWGS